MLLHGVQVCCQKGVEDVSTYLSVAAKWQVYRQAEQVVNKVLKG